MIRFSRSPAPATPARLRHVAKSGRCSRRQRLRLSVRPRSPRETRGDASLLELAPQSSDDRLLPTAMTLARFSAVPTPTEGCVSKLQHRFQQTACLLYTSPSPRDG